MNTASLELSKELFEISGWKTKVDDKWYDASGEFPSIDTATAVCPAYDLDFVLQKLPQRLPSPHNSHLQVSHITPNEWEAGYRALWGKANNPTDAVCVLAVLLFEAGILTKYEGVQDE